jgi:hypothetical protein
MTAVVYYSYPKGEVPLFAPRDDQLDPFAPDFTPFIGHEAFMVAPDYHLVQNTWMTLVSALLVIVRDYNYFAGFGAAGTGAVSENLDIPK